MASPQTENGFIRIATELFKALRSIRIPGESRQIFDCVIEKTYGWHKKEDSIALDQFVEMTGLKKPTVCRAIKKLITMNMIIKKDNHKKPKYCIQKNYTHWTPLSKKIIVSSLSKKITNVIKKDNKSLSKKITPITYKRKVKDTTKEKSTRLGYKNVLLTDEEFEKLKKKWPQTYKQKIFDLDDYGYRKKKKFKEYTDHYRTILNWNKDSPVEHPDRPIHNEKPMPRVKRLESPESKAVLEQMNNLIKDRPANWQLQLKEKQKQLNKIQENLSTRKVGDLIN